MQTHNVDIGELKSCGEDVRISHLAVLRRPELVALGNHVSIDEFFVCSTALEIGDHVHISTHVSVIGGAQGLLKMGNFTNLSARATIICGSDEFKGHGLVSAPGIPEEYRDRLTVEPVILENFVNTGVQVTILPGVTIPEGAVIGACSLVRKKDVLKPWTIYAGNPLREIGARTKERMLDYAAKLGH